MKKTIAVLILLFSSPVLGQDIYSNPSSVGVAAVGQIPATQTNSTPCVTCVGALVQSSVPITTVTLTTVTNADLTSIPLAAGNWWVWGNIGVACSAAVTGSSTTGWISTVSATNPSFPNGGAKAASNSAFSAALGSIQLPVGGIVLSLSGPITVFLSVEATLAGGTCTGGGYIGAYRIN